MWPHIFESERRAAASAKALPPCVCYEGESSPFPWFTLHTPRLKPCGFILTFVALSCFLQWTSWPTSRLKLCLVQTVKRYVLLKSNSATYTLTDVCKPPCMWKPLRKLLPWYTERQHFDNFVASYWTIKYVLHLIDTVSDFTSP